MTISVMSWNIDKFNQSTLDRTDYNGDHILDVFTSSPLDIVVIIEVQSDQGTGGTLIGGSGRTGLLTLLADLRAEDQYSGWQLVPPPRLNDNILGPAHTEGIGVFYRSATLTFTGPYYYQGPAHVATAAGPGQAYAGLWANALPPGNLWAPQVAFYAYGGALLNFPNAGNRPPMLTTFTVNGTTRTIRLLSFHLPPNQATAALALPQLTAIRELFANLGANDVVVAAGDLNYDPARVTTASAAMYYNGTRATFRDFRGFTAANGVTRIVDTAYASPALVGGGLRDYQRVRNPNGTRTVNHLDNAFVRYGTQPVAAPAFNPQVVDMVAGTGDWRTSMSQTIAAIQGQQLYDPVALFRQENNYGHIARWQGVSDHLPIVIDIP
jgi:endonuclease/exonuclease/phosphatase family protein